MANVRSLSDIKKEGGSGGGGGGGGRGGGGGPSHGGGGGHGHAHGGGRGQQAPQDNKNVKMIGSGEQFKKELSAAGERLVIVDWSAEWCGPCRQMAPVFAQLSTTYTNAVFLRVDVDDLQELAHQYNIKSLPTFTFIRAGRKIDEMIGASPEKLEAMVKQHVGQAQALPSSGGYRLGGGGGEPSHAGAAPHPTAAASSHASSAAAGASAGTAAPAPGPAGGSAKDSRRPANAAAIAQLQEMGPWSKELCEKALLETGNSVPNALDWLFTHGDEAAPSAGQKLGGSAPPPQAVAAAAAPAAAPTPAAEAKPEAMQVDSGAGAPAAAPAAAPATDVAPPHLHNARCDMCKEQIIGIRYKCNDCVDFDLCSGCEVKKTHDPNHTFTAYEKEYVQPELTPEQVALQKQRIAAKLAEIRKKEEEEAAKAEKEREITRRKEAKNTEEAKRKWEEAEAKRAADKARREKEAEEKHKAKVLEQLRIDKLNREAAKKKAEGGQPDPVAAPAPAAPAAAPAAPAAKKEYTECVVQIRTADGKTLQQTFKPTDTLRAVYTFAQQSGVKGNFALLSTFPRKVYHGAALDSTTLQQAELVPRGNLNVATSW